MSTEASRAKHKFAVKRNSWPKTRGVAMNPVDHVSVLESAGRRCGADIIFYSLTVVVTTSTSVRPRPSPATPHRVKRPVLLLPGEPVCSVVRRRRRSRFTGDAWVRVFFAAGSGFLGANSTHYVPGNKKHGACELSTAIFQSRSRVRGVVRGVLRCRATQLHQKLKRQIFESHQNECVRYDVQK